MNETIASQKKRRLSGMAAAAVTALAATVCCIAPAVLLVLGITGVHFFEVLEPWRPLIILGEIGGFFLYKRLMRGTSCAIDGPCADSAWQRFEQSFFWSVVALGVGIIVLLVA